MKCSIFNTDKPMANVVVKHTSQWGKNPSIGIHLLQPTSQELVEGFDRAYRGGFKTIYVYESPFHVIKGGK